MNSDDMRKFMQSEGPLLLEAIKLNRAKLDACRKHCFVIPEPPYKIGQKATCSKCGGTMHLTDAYVYTRGYEAAGGNPNDIIPGFEVDELP